MRRVLTEDQFIMLHEIAKAGLVVQLTIRHSDKDNYQKSMLSITEEKTEHYFEGGSRVFDKIIERAYLSVITDIDEKVQARFTEATSVRLRIAKFEALGGAVEFMAEDADRDIWVKVGIHEYARSVLYHRLDEELRKLLLILSPKKRIKNDY